MYLYIVPAGALCSLKNDIGHKGEVMPRLLLCSSHSAGYCYDYGPGL